MVSLTDVTSDSVHVSRIANWMLLGCCWIWIAVGTVSEQLHVRGFCERTVPVVMLILTAVTTAGCGGRILCRWSNPLRRPLEFLCLSSALGWAVLSFLLCLLAVCRLFKPSIIVPLAILCSVEFGIGTRHPQSGVRMWRSVPWIQGIRVYRRTAWSLISLLLTLAVITVTALWALGPVWDYDSEMYHLPNSSQIVVQQGLVVSHQEPLANLPGQAYLWFALGLAADAEGYPALLNCWATVMTSLLASSLASRWLGIRTAMWTLPVYWSALIVHAVASTPRIEPFYSFMFLAAVAWLFESIQKRQFFWRTVLWSGTCLGTSAAIKAQGLYSWPIVGVWLVFVKGSELWIAVRASARWKDGKKRLELQPDKVEPVDTRLLGGRAPVTLKKITCLFLVGFVILSPWWIKNYRAFGNPVHPMFNRQVDADSLRNANPHVPHHPNRPWYFLLSETADLFLRPNSFSGPPGQWPHYLFLLSPLSLCFLFPRPAVDRSRFSSVRNWLDFLRSEKSFLVTLILMSGAYYALALTLTHELRHQFGMFALASILVAYVIAEAEIRWKLKVFLPGLVSVALLLVLLFPARLALLPKLVTYIVGGINGASFRKSAIPANFPNACEWCQKNLPSDAIILLCWESRVYRLPGNVIADPGSCTWKTLFRGRDTQEQIAEYLHGQGVDYVLVNESALVYNVERSALLPASTYQEFLRQRKLLVPDVLEPVFEYPPGKAKSVTVYRVLGRRRAAAGKKS